MLPLSFTCKRGSPSIAQWSQSLSWLVMPAIGGFVVSFGGHGTNAFFLEKATNLVFFVGASSAAPTMSAACNSHFCQFKLFSTVKTVSSGSPRKLVQSVQSVPLTWRFCVGTRAVPRARTSSSSTTDRRSLISFNWCSVWSNNYCVRACAFKPWCSTACSLFITSCSPRNGGGGPGGQKP